MEQLASLFLHSRTQAHTFHLGVKGIGSHSAHVALGEYYSEIGEIIDGLVESYQGKFGLIKFQAVNGLDTNCDIKNIIGYFEKLCSALDKLRKDEKLQSSYLQNQIDTIEELLYSTKYKLVNHQ
jgi:DNA-binding ferritin-like protein